MLIRIRSKDGNFRFEFEPTADISELVAKIISTATDPDPSTIMISNQPRGNEANVSKLKGRNLQNLGLKHGDLVFVTYQTKAASSTSPHAQTSVPTTTTPGNGQPSVPASHPNRPWENVQEDPVDTYWRSRDGKIPRKRDALFCKHGANGMCDNCMPLEPYDAGYHAEHNIKHLSYHAYLRKLAPAGAAAAASSSSGSAALLPPLEPPSYRVKVPCPTGNHPAWPAGICTGCQPSAITLSSQAFRMVDHLEIASTDIVERFLRAWRATGLQRFGWLVGRYAPYEEVPMGVKAVVEAIYEPPQEGELDGLTLGVPWEEEPRIRELARAASAPLTIVGCVYTDLDPTPEDRTKNVYKRHAGSFFFSSLETVFAATLQQAHPTPSRASATGAFASRLVTAVLTGTADGAVDIAAYQVSEQAVAMVDADMIEASVDPGIVRVKPEDRTQGSARYVPDVFFSYKNEYGLEVKKSAKPCFPVEYLLVNVTHGFPQSPSPLFRSTAFAIENRPGLENQTVEGAMRELARLRAPDVSAGQGTPAQKVELARWLSDLHLVAFLGTTQLLSQEDMKTLMRAVTSPTLLDDPSVLDAVFRTESWQTLMTFTRETAPPPRAPSFPTGDDAIPPDLLDDLQRASPAPGGSGTAGVKVCPHCTFENDAGASDCEVCGLPLG